MKSGDSVHATNKDEPDRPALDLESTTHIDKVFRLLPSRFQSGKVDKDIVYYFSIDDEKWTVTVRSDGCEVTPGKPAEADCFLKTSSDLLMKIFKGEYTPSIMDFISGKIRSNRPDLLLTFKEVFGD